MFLVSRWHPLDLLETCVTRIYTKRIAQARYAEARSMTLTQTTRAHNVFMRSILPVVSQVVLDAKTARPPEHEQMTKHIRMTTL
jgi:hypothetical protein